LSFYFLVVAVLYTYIGVSYVVCRFLSYGGNGTGAIYTGFLYFITSGIGLIKLFIHYNQALKKDAHL
ncbi:MAG: DUF2157 domain-containing protein, partial [Bacteroidota bacterium]|nr:DUF2157 domain-containing protein [Bacteroidota bacterium]